MRPTLTTLHPFISASPKNTLSNLDYLTIKHSHGYHSPTTAKNSGQNWSSDKLKMRGRILHKYGFFCACKISRVMTGCIEGLSSPPRSFSCGTPILYNLSPFQLELKVTVSNLLKETVPMSINPTSGNTSAIIKLNASLVNHSVTAQDLNNWLVYRDDNGELIGWIALTDFDDYQACILTTRLNRLNVFSGLSSYETALNFVVEAR